jgi:hypothetical protein
VSWFAKRLRGPCKKFREAIRVAPDAEAVYREMDAFVVATLTDADSRQWQSSLPLEVI